MREGAHLVRAGSRARVPVCGLRSRPGKRGDGRCEGAERRASLEKTRDWGRRAWAIRSRESRKHRRYLFTWVQWLKHLQRGEWHLFVPGGLWERGREFCPYVPGEFDFEGRRGEINLGKPTKRGEVTRLSVNFIYPSPAKVAAWKNTARLYQ